MKIRTPWRDKLLAVVGLSMIAVVWGGCSPAAETPGEQVPNPSPPQIGRRTEKAVAAVKTPPATTEAGREVAAPSKPVAKNEAVGARAKKALPPEEVVTEELEEIAAKPRDLGQPLVDDPKVLKRLQPSDPIWLDPKNKQVVLIGEACKAGYPLEFFATYSNRSYEAVVALNVTPRFIHAALMAVGAKPGHPARFQPDFSPPTGTEIAIELRWKDGKGIHSAPAGDWVRDIKTKRPLAMNWVFAGSQFIKDEETGKESYQADGGDMICVLSLPGAMLDLPLHGSRDLESRSFEAFAEHLPPAGTPVTILLKPVLTAAAKAAEPSRGATRHEPAKPSGPAAAKAEKEASQAAMKWLKLLDDEEYSRAWEAASDDFKANIDRREWIKSIADARKPLGRLKTRQPEPLTYEETNTEAGRTPAFAGLYHLTFANGKQAAETIVLTPDRSKACACRRI